MARELKLPIVATAAMCLLSCAMGPAHADTPSANDIISRRFEALPADQDALVKRQIRVPLRPSPAGDTFYVSVEINEAVTIDMMVDSGAADVSISEEVFQGLGADVVKVGEREYRIANGSIVRRDLITIRTLKVGDLVLNNVRASVGPGPLLLGQAFLRRLDAWSIDNAANVLVLEHSEEAPPVETPKNTARDEPPTLDPPPRYRLTDPPGFQPLRSIFGPPTYKPSPSPKDTARFQPEDPRPPVVGGYVVQVSSQRSEADAHASFRSLQSKYPRVLGDREPIVRRADLSPKGIYYRALIGPFETAADADQFCSDLKGAGGQCIVQKN
jgi:clan AA aspartic protease (TIGR02281 family)